MAQRAGAEPAGAYKDSSDSWAAHRGLAGHVVGAVRVVAGEQIERLGEISLQQGEGQGEGGE